MSCNGIVFSTAVFRRVLRARRLRQPTAVFAIAQAAEPAIIDDRWWGQKVRRQSDVHAEPPPSALNLLKEA